MKKYIFGLLPALSICTIAISCSQGLEEKVASLELENAALGSKVSSLESEKSDLNEKVKSLGAEKGKIELELAKLEGKIEGLKTQNEKAKQDLVLLNDKKTEDKKLRFSAT